MPAAFLTAPSILNTRTAVGFVDGSGVWAEGSMDYFATDAEQEVTLVLRSDDREVYRKSRKEAREDWLPASRSFHTMVSFGVSADCGHSADGETAHRAWHKFLIGGWKFLSWGHQIAGSGGDAAQSPCAAPPPESSGSGGGGGEYDTGCESCQQWFWYEDGQIVDEWWECTPIDPIWCEGLAT